MHRFWTLNRKRRCRAAAVLGLALALGAARDLAAHDEKVSASEIDVAEREVVWRIDVGVAGLAKAIEIPAEPAALSESALQAAKQEIARYLAAGVSLEVNGRPAAPVPGRLEPIYEPFVLSAEPYIARVRQELRFRSEDPIERLRIRLRLFAELTGEHRAVVVVHWERETRQWVRVGPTQLDLTRGSLRPTFLGIAREFVAWGAHHIFIGYDHVAFLLALLLAARRVGSMIGVVTSFTVAHSLTLALSALDVLRIDPAVTESLIAASIVYVAAENYFVGDGRHRWLLTFAFGLVHGLGFSTVLKERLNEAPGVLAPVLAFNVGVELGQIAILAIAYPLMVQLRRGADPSERERRSRRLIWIGSLPILLLGLGWLFERAFGFQFMPI